MVPAARQQSDSRVDSDNADVRLWAAGTPIAIPPGSTTGPGPAAARDADPDPNTPGLLEVRNVRATARALVNGEGLVCEEDLTAMIAFAGPVTCLLWIASRWIVVDLAEWGGGEGHPEQVDKHTDRDGRPGYSY
jgi:hypothetical protein